jgi:hypothetical protein
MDLERAIQFLVNNHATLNGRLDGISRDLAVIKTNLPVGEKLLVRTAFQVGKLKGFTERRFRQTDERIDNLAGKITALLSRMPSNGNRPRH